MPTIVCCPCCNATCVYTFSSTYSCDEENVGSWSTPTVIDTQCCPNGQVLNEWSYDGCTATIHVGVGVEACDGAEDCPSPPSPPAVPSTVPSGCECTDTKVCARRYVAYWNCESESENKWEITAGDHVCIPYPINEESHPTSWTIDAEDPCRHYIYVLPTVDEETVPLDCATGEDCEEHEYVEPSPPPNHDGCDCEPPVCNVCQNCCYSNESTATVTLGVPEFWEYGGYTSNCGEYPEPSGSPDCIESGVYNLTWKGTSVNVAGTFTFWGDSNYGKSVDEATGIECDAFGTPEGATQVKCVLTVLLVATCFNVGGIIGNRFLCYFQVNQYCKFGLDPDEWDQTHGMQIFAGYGTEPPFNDDGYCWEFPAGSKDCDGGQIGKTLAKDWSTETNIATDVRGAGSCVVQINNSGCDYCNEGPP